MTLENTETEKRSGLINLVVCSNVPGIVPSIAQLVERWTVAGYKQISIGRWFKSGSKDFFFIPPLFKVFV